MFRVGDPPPASHAYEKFFGLVESPFGLTPNPRFLFESRSHAAALEQVTSALRRREAIVVLTGEVGTGKTLLCRTVLQRLEPQTLVCVVSNPRLTSDDLLQQVLTDFAVTSAAAGAGSFDVVQTLQQFLASPATLRAQSVIMIDEAQHLRPEVLEQIRLLSTFEADGHKLLQIILVGQGELETLLQRPESRQLDQRVSRRHQLQPLEPDEVRHYIERRLWVAHGGLDALLGSHPGPADRPASDSAFWRVRFTAAAMRAIAAIAQGLPRLVNLVCDRSLEITYQRRRRTVEVGDVLAAARKLGLPVPLGQRVLSHRTAAAAVVGLLGVGGALALGVVPGGPEPDEAAPGAATPAALETAVEPVVATTGSPLPLAEAESFTVVVASFRTPGHAEGLAGRIAVAGLPAFTRMIDGWHQVMVGPYASRDEALQAQARLERDDVSGTQLVERAPRPAASAAR